MKITNISVQVKNKDRVNISVDGTYRFSLDIYQLSELGIKLGKEYSENELAELENESQFGKLYAKALEYTMLRPHSAKEIRDYLWRKTRTTKYRSRASGELLDRPGVSQALVDRVYERLQDKGYINDEHFSRLWVENRNLHKGISQRKLAAELHAKGIDNLIIEAALRSTERDENEELQKVIRKKKARYPDEQKFIMYLLRQGFSYDAIKQTLLSDNIED